MAKHISKVEPGDLVKRISDSTIHLVRTTDSGACQFGLADELPTSMHPWAAFEVYEGPVRIEETPDAPAHPTLIDVPPATQTEPELPQS